MKKLFIVLFICIGGHAFAQEGTPNQFKEVDTNGDGQIQVNEVQRMIDGFFIGTHDHGVMYIHNLIDYFFEQE